MAKLPITPACGDHDRTPGLPQGTVVPVRTASNVKDDRPVIAVPAFPSRFFHHSSVDVNTQADIERPQDLSGKRVGAAPAGLFAPGTLQGFQV